MIRFFNKDVKYITPKLCVNCEHFKKTIQLTSDSPFGMCKLFGTFDLVDGKITYDYASVARSDSYKCGETAKLFKIKNDNTN
jgi:hypothetical protein